MIINGDSLEILKTLEPNSIDSVVTDPPYGLAFMGKKWDYDVPSVELWREVLRVLKPGGHVLSFGGTRTYHRMVVKMEDAGFEIRDQLQWIYGSGFPKSLDVSKALDKAYGAEREVVGAAKRSGSNSRAFQSEDKTTAGQHFDTAPSTDLAKQWQGWGTALKPANEPIVLARKPLVGTVAANVEKFGTGALNIDASRIGYQDQQDIDRARGRKGDYDKTGVLSGLETSVTLQSQMYKGETNNKGRWPANVLFDEEAAAMLDDQSGVLKTGGASRFFYVAKASKRERNAGLEGLPTVEKRSAGGTTSSGKPTMEGRDRFGCQTQNHHPTVKPVKLMEYLVRLITLPGGTVLDPFMGSGTTGVAAKSLGFNFIGVELSPEYAETAKRRIDATA